MATKTVKKTSSKKKELAQINPKLKSILDEKLAKALECSVIADEMANEAKKAKEEAIAIMEECKLANYSLVDSDGIVYAALTRSSRKNLVVGDARRIAATLTKAQLMECFKPTATWLRALAEAVTPAKRTLVEEALVENVSISYRMDKGKSDEAKAFAKQAIEASREATDRRISGMVERMKTPTK